MLVIVRGRVPALVIAFGCAACGRIAFDPVTGGSLSNDAMDAPPPYHATAVRFQRAGGDCIDSNALSMAQNSGRGVFSVWLNFTGNDGMTQELEVAMILLTGGITREQNNRIRFQLPNCVGLQLLDMTTQATYTASSGWIHVLASWDLSAGKADLYVNDVSDKNQMVLNNGTICYTAGRWGFGGITNGTLDADVADVYGSFGNYIDLSAEANRRLFSDTNGKPVDLSPICKFPTGNAPTECFTGDLASWATNKGYGGGFTTRGDGLALAPTSPSD
jgi:hypothetical protein